MSASSLHRESTDSLLFISQCFGMQATLALQVLYYAVALVGDTFLSMLMHILHGTYSLTNLNYYSVHNYYKYPVDCTAGFYVERSSGLCRPECGEWDQYSTATRRTVYGINITFVLLTILICVTTIIWSIFRRKIM